CRSWRGVPTACTGCATRPARATPVAAGPCQALATCWPASPRCGCRGRSPRADDAPTPSRRSTRLVFPRACRSSRVTRLRTPSLTRTCSWRRPSASASTSRRRWSSATACGISWPRGVRVRSEWACCPAATAWTSSRPPAPTASTRTRPTCCATWTKSAFARRNKAVTADASPSAVITPGDGDRPQLISALLHLAEVREAHVLHRLTLQVRILARDTPRGVEHEADPLLVLHLDEAAQATLVRELHRAVLDELGHPRVRAENEVAHASHRRLERMVQLGEPGLHFRRLVHARHTYPARSSASLPESVTSTKPDG